MPEDLDSILSEAVESGLPQRWLSWHYRSRDESLIAFSNRYYYDNKLSSLPSPGAERPTPACAGAGSTATSTGRELPHQRGGGDERSSPRSPAGCATRRPATTRSAS